MIPKPLSTQVKILLTGDVVSILRSREDINIFSSEMAKLRVFLENEIAKNVDSISFKFEHGDLNMPLCADEELVIPIKPLQELLQAIDNLPNNLIDEENNFEMIENLQKKLKTIIDRNGTI